MQPASLLTLAVCSLLLHPALGFPTSRQVLAKSAREDDLISGSDFLSVFIGATVPRTRPRNRNYKVSKRPDSVSFEESITRTSYFDDGSGSSESSFGTRTIQKGSYPLPAESLARSFASQESDVSQNDDKQNAFGEVSTDSLGFSTTLADENDPINDEEPQKPSNTNTSLIDANPKDAVVDHIGESSITNSERVQYLSNTSTEKRVGLSVKSDKIEENYVFTSSTASPNYEAMDINDNLTTITSPLEESSPTVLNKSSELKEAPNSPDVDTQIDNVYSSNNEYSLASLSDSDSKTEGETVASPSEWSPSYHIPEETTPVSKNETHQVISVRVSSSVALQQNNKIDDNKDVFIPVLDPLSQSTKEESNDIPAETISLVTEEEPAATAIQRSQFSVEEASPSSSIISVHQETSSSDAQSRSNVFSASGSIESPVDPQSSPVSYHTSISTATSGSRVQFYREPPSYHRSASSVAETIHRAVVAHQQQQPLQTYGQVSSVFQGPGRLNLNNEGNPSESVYDSSKHAEHNYQSNNPQGKIIAEKIKEGFEHHHHPDAQIKTDQVFQTDNNRAQKSYEIHHQEPQERNYELPEEIYVTPEKAYAAPEQNYEVDESVSVMTNGRAHGVQYPPVTTPGHDVEPAFRELNADEGQTRDPNSKFGYVVEGRNYRKYQVEERTPDGFIVGEYGVVRHDDGSLRGVRYTADGTTSPKLIYKALIEFLKL